MGVIWIVYGILLVALAPFTPFAILLMVGPLIATGWYAKHWAVPLGAGLAHGAALAGLTWWLGAFDSWPAGSFALAAAILMLLSWFTALAGRTVRIMQDLRQRTMELEEAEMTIADSAASTQAIYEASTVGLVALDADAKIVSWNPGAETVFGRSAPSMVGKKFETLAAEGDPDDCMGPIRYALETGRQIPAFAGRLLHGDGYLLDVEVKARPVDGHARLILTIIDHTREHDMEDALITQSEMHDRLLKNLDEVMYSVEVPSMTTAFLTKTVEELTGQPPGRFKDFSDLLALAHPDDVEAVERRWRHARTGERSTLRWRIRNPEGGHWWVEDRVLPVRNDEGLVVRLDGILRRIFREIELERQALRMTKWLDALEPIAGSGAWALDLRSGEWQWSPGMHNLMGTDPRDEITDDVWHRLIPPDAMERILADPENAAPVIVEAGHAQRLVLEPWLQRGNDGEPIVVYGVMRPAAERPERPRRRPAQESPVELQHGGNVAERPAHRPRPVTAAAPAVSPLTDPEPMEHAGPPAAEPSVDDAPEHDTEPATEPEPVPIAEPAAEATHDEPLHDLEPMHDDAPHEAEPMQDIEPMHDDAPHEAEPMQDIEPMHDDAPHEAEEPMREPGPTSEQAPEPHEAPEPMAAEPEPMPAEGPKPAEVEMDVKWDDEFGWVPQPRKTEEIQAKTWPENEPHKRKGPWALD